MPKGFSGFPNTQKKNDEDSDDDNDDDITSLIKSYNNHIYFYAPVNDKTALALNMTINQVTNSVMKNCVDFETCPNIYLHINSGGGEVNAALSTVDTIRNNKVPIVSIIDNVPDWLNKGSHNPPSTNPKIIINKPELVLSKLFGKKFNKLF